MTLEKILKNHCKFDGFECDGNYEIWIAGNVSETPFQPVLSIRISVTKEEWKEYIKWLKKYTLEK